MEKLNVQVGFVYTQVMFCDEHGKLQFHRVMTDVDKPWESIKEVLVMVKQALCMDKPKGYNYQIQTVNIDLQYRKVNFSSTLESLEEEMEHYISHGTQLSIQTVRMLSEVLEIRAEEKAEKMGWGIAGDVNHEELFLDLLWSQEKCFDVDIVQSIDQGQDNEKVDSEEGDFVKAIYPKDCDSFSYFQSMRDLIFRKVNGKVVNDLRGSPGVENRGEIRIFEDG